MDDNVCTYIVRLCAEESKNYSYKK